MQVELNGSFRSPICIAMRQPVLVRPSYSLSCAIILYTNGIGDVKGSREGVINAISPGPLVRPVLALPFLLLDLSTSLLPPSAKLTSVLPKLLLKRTLFFWDF